MASLPGFQLQSAVSAADGALRGRDDLVDLEVLDVEHRADQQADDRRYDDVGGDVAQDHDVARVLAEWEDS